MEILSEVIRSALNKTIENKLKSNKFLINVSLASKAGETNFVGIVHRVSFKSEGGENDDKLILKVAPQNAARRIQFHSRPFFLREIRIYNEVLPYFHQFEQSKDISIANCFTEYAKCYRTTDTELNECIILEDLSVRDLTIIDQFTQEVTIDHACLLMQALGKFHALSFAVKDQKPEDFAILSSNLTEICLLPSNLIIKHHLNKLFEVVLEMLSGEEDVNVLNKLQTLFKRDSIDIIGDCLDLDSTGSASVITHGDAWQNNLMFRYDKSGKPIEICFLDWQGSKHVSPVIDIVYFVFCCTTKELRDSHYEHLLNIYYDSLDTHTKRLGTDLQKFFPFALMQEHLCKFGKYGLILAMLLLPVITAERRGDINLDQMSEDSLNGNISDRNTYVSEKSCPKFNKRLRDVVIDMVRLEYV